MTTTQTKKQSLDFLLVWARENGRLEIWKALTAECPCGGTGLGWAGHQWEGAINCEGYGRVSLSLDSAHIAAEDWILENDGIIDMKKWEEGAEFTVLVLLPTTIGDHGRGNDIFEALRAALEKR